MNIAILHYHLNPGGVTRVVENHLRAIDAVSTQTVRVAILHGGRVAGWPAELSQQVSNTHVSLHALPDLDYDDESPASPAVLAATIRETLAGLRFRPDDTVLHVHNHSLGKNVALPVVVTDLAAEGWRLLLQIHDFAEDFRPANYRRWTQTFGPSYAAKLYPQASQIHYAVLNRRDHAVLADAGVPAERLHLLPNPVLTPATIPDRDAARSRLESAVGLEAGRRYVLYPVRGIRRKNLGETVLLSLLDERDSLYGVALPPLNPVAIPAYDRWQNVIQELRCPIRFGTGQIGQKGMPFDEHLAAADAAVTTSVAEGFGMAFLEPWLAGLPLTGRDLPDVTADFRAAGVQLDHLYERFNVPIDGPEVDQFAKSLQRAGDALLADYGRPPISPSDWQSLADRKSAGGIVDFGDLDESLQEGVLRRAADSPMLRRELHSLNPHLSITPTAEHVAANGNCIRSAFGLQPIGRQLVDLYDHLAQTTPGTIDPPFAGETILSHLLDLDRLRLLRTS